MVLALCLAHAAHAQSDNTPPVITLNSAAGTTTFSALPAPLVGQVSDAGGLGEVSVYLKRSNNGTPEYWNGNAWLAGTITRWNAALGAVGAGNARSWSVNPTWPRGADLPPGSYVLRVFAWDAASNRADIVRPVEISAPDTTAPALTIVAPTNDYLLDTAQGTLSGINGTTSDAGGAGVGSVVVRISRSWTGATEFWSGTSWGSARIDLQTALGAPNASGLRNWSVSAALPSAQQWTTGTYSLSAISTDLADNRTVVAQTLNVAPRDTVAPGVSIAFPAPDQALSELIQLRGGATDDGSGVARVAVFLRRTVNGANNTDAYQYWNGQSWAADLTTACYLPSSEETGWTRNQNLPAGANLPTGFYTVCARAVDRYRNSSEIVENTFRIVPVAPLRLDAHIRASAGGAGNDNGAWLGEDIVNGDAAGQTLAATARAGQTQERQIRLRLSGGSGSQSVRVTLPDWPEFAAPGWGWTAEFFDAPTGGANISAQITSAAGWTTTMTNGAERTIRVHVTAPYDLITGDPMRALTLRAEANPTSETPAVDVVRATWTGLSATPDLSVSASGPQSANWQGVGLFSDTDGANQTLSRIARPGVAVKAWIKLEMADAGAGETASWNVPGWSAFAAGGWSARFFDEAKGDAEITNQITTGYWLAPADGAARIIRVEIMAPAGATDVTRALSVRAQSESGERDTVKVSVRVLRNAQPDVAVRREIETEFTGQNVLSPTAQRLELLTEVGATEKFEVKITNKTNESAQFLFEPPTNLAEGWSYRLYDEEGVWLNIPGNDDLNIVTPLIMPYQSLNWRLELVTSPTNGSTRVVPVTFSAAGALDKCQIAVRLQGVIGADYSLDGGVTWKKVEGETLSVPQGSTVGFKAVPLNPDEPWPDDPFAPTWNHNGKPFWGELTYLYYPTSTPEGEDGETVDVSCGNTFSMKVKVEAEKEE